MFVSDHDPLAPDFCETLHPRLPIGKFSFAVSLNANAIAAIVTIQIALQARQGCYLNSWNLHNGVQLGFKPIG